MVHGTDDASGRFVRRLSGLQADVDAIRRDLAPPDHVELAVRSRRTLREARTLLDTNLSALFAGETSSAREDLHGWLEYAEQQVTAALTLESEPAAILRRLTLAASLLAVVLEAVSSAVEDLRRRQVI